MEEALKEATENTTASIVQFLSFDHARLDGLLFRSSVRSGEIERAPYDAFRRGLLRHIGIEEKLLLPYVREAGDEELKATAATLRLHHGAIASLLALDPAPNVIRALQYILAIHNPLEEGSAGFYARCEHLSRNSDELRIAVIAAPEVPLAVRPQTEFLQAAARRALVRAGLPETLLDS